MSASKLLLVVLATVVIFATGVITGGLLVRKTTPPPSPSSPPVAVFPGRFDMLRRGTDSLEDLTLQQRDHIDRIIRDSQERLADFFLLFEPDIQNVFRKMREDIRSELTPDQRRRLEQFMREQRLRGPLQRPGRFGGPFRGSDVEAPKSTQAPPAQAPQPQKP